MTNGASDLSLAEQIDAICDRFEHDFRSGNEPQIESRLGDLQEPLRSSLLKAMLGVEIELRRQQGDKPEEQQYLARFPEQAEAVRQAFAEMRSVLSSVTMSAVETSQRAAAPKTKASTGGERRRNLGRFKILAVLGEGAFGTVYRARDPQLDREVAIKVPRFGTLQSDGERERFSREARAAANLHHANICPVHEVGEIDGCDYIVMAFIDGKPLSKVLETQTKPSEKQIASVVRRLALALQEAHDKGIIHRDLKPANIMINRKGEPVIMDFGLARRENSGDAQISQSGQIMGTPAYMSPEQARGDGKTVGPAADIYSLGVVFYELLCGRRPFEGTITEVIGKILHVEAEPPSKHRAGVESRLEEICLKAIAKQPADRFASMKEFADALTEYLKTGSTVQPKASATVQVRAQDQALHTQGFAELMAAVSSDLEKKVERAVLLSGKPQKVKIPWWTYLVGSGLMGVVVLLGIIFLIRKDTVTVIVNIPIENIHDPSLSFFLDDRPIDADAFAAPMELDPGKHRLVVNKDGKLFKEFKFNVDVTDNKPIEPDDVTPKPSEPKREVKPSPLDVLRAADIPDEKLVKLYGGRAAAPKELVAVYPTIRPDNPDDDFHGFAISPDGKTLATASYPWDMIELRNLASGQKFAEIGFSTPRYSEPFFTWLQFAPDGKTIYGARQERDLIAFSVPEGRELWRTQVRGNWCLPALSPDGMTLVCADPNQANTAIQIHDADTGKRRSSWTDVPIGPTCRMAFAPDGRTLAVISGNTHALTIVNCNDGSVRKTLELPRSPYAPVFSRDGKKVYHSHHWKEPENYFIETDLESGLSREYHRSPGGCRLVAVNPEFPILASSDAKSLQIWDAEAGPEQTPYLLPIGCAAEQFRFTPEGRYLIVGSDSGIFVFRLPVDRKVGDWDSLKQAKTEPAVVRDVTPKPTSPQSGNQPDRIAAEAVLALGGQVTIEGGDGVPRNIDAVSKLPGEPFQVVFACVWPGQATSADYLSKLRGLTGLTSVLLHSPPFSDGDFEILASMPNLQQFNLGASRLNGSGFRLLRGSAGIRQITLWGESQIDDQALAEIGSLPNLELLAFASPNVTAAGLRKLKPLPRLRALTVNTNFNSEMVAAIGECEQLTELLALNGTGIVDADLRHLGRLSRLPALWIGQPSITDEGVRALGGLSQLTSLRVTHSRITAAVPIGLNGFVNLRNLSLGFSNLHGIDFSDLKLPLVGEVFLQNCRLTDDDLRGLAGLPRLQTLFVSDNPLTDAAIDEIAKISTLRKILINGTGITRQGVEQLKRLRPELTVEGGP